MGTGMGTGPGAGVGTGTGTGTLNGNGQEEPGGHGPPVLKIAWGIHWSQGL